MGKPEVNHPDEKKSGFGKRLIALVGWEVPRVFLVVTKPQTLDCHGKTVRDLRDFSNISRNCCQ
jgi:hypothetical protein